EELNRITIAWPSELQWTPAAKIVETLKYSLTKLAILRELHTEQVRKGTLMLHCVVDGAEHLVALDYSDYPDFINEEALRECDLYLKMEWRKAGYGDP